MSSLGLAEVPSFRGSIAKEARVSELLQESTFQHAYASCNLLVKSVAYSVFHVATPTPVQRSEGVGGPHKSACPKNTSHLAGASWTVAISGEHPSPGTVRRLARRIASSKLSDMTLPPRPRSRREPTAEARDAREAAVKQVPRPRRLAPYGSKALLPTRAAGSGSSQSRGPYCQPPL